MSSYDQHKEMYKLLTQEGDCVLSTISSELEGYPFGSVTPYCLDENFNPHILISSIAQHTKNINANAKVSLLISETGDKTNKQSLARLTYIGNAQKVIEDETIKKRYLNYFPEAASYFNTHDFSFYRIEPVRLRFIGGFGKIYWIEKSDLTVKNLFSVEEEMKIVSHMNEDHQHNLKDYARFYLGYHSQDEDSIRMCGLDQFGVDLLINESKKRIEFKTHLSDSSMARSVFVEMAKEARKA